VVGRHDQNKRGGIVPNRQSGRHSGGRRRVAPERLEDDSRHRCLSSLELLGDRKPVFGIGNDEQGPKGGWVCDATGGCLEQGFVAEEREELLRIGLS
jgi:hypothetical protein